MRITENDMRRMWADGETVAQIAAKVRRVNGFMPIAQVRKVLFGG